MKKTGLWALFSVLFFMQVMAAPFQGDEYGLASYYSSSFQGKRTASGERYNSNKFTASHKVLPFGTIVRVTRLDNNKSVKVRINDRGPFVNGRVTDLSYVAAEALGIVGHGETKVKIEILNQPGNLEKAQTNVSPIEKEQYTSLAHGDRSVDELTDKGTPVVTSDSKPKEYNVKSVGKPKSKATPSKSGKKNPLAKKVSDFSTLSSSPYGLFKVQIIRPKQSGFGIQLASVSQFENVMNKVADLQKQFFKNILISIEKGEDGHPLYKIILGPFPDQKTAQSYLLNAQKKKKIDGYVVDLNAIKYP